MCNNNLLYKLKNNLKLFNLSFIRSYSRIYNNIKKLNTTKKRKHSLKYKLNLLNNFYSYTASYISKHIYNYIYKLKYLKQFIITKNNSLNTIILHYKRIFIKKKQKKSMKYNIIIGSGCYKSWLGIGINKNIIYKKACEYADLKSKKYIYNLNFKTNDYKTFKYKNYKFSLLNKAPNNYNLSVYNDIIFLTGLKKFKLISHSNCKNKTILKSFLYHFN